MSESPELARTIERKGWRKRGVAAQKIDLLTLEDIDGRTRARQLAVRMRDGLVSDLGGDVTTAQSALAQRAAILHSILEDLEARWCMGSEIDIPTYTTASAEQRRLLTTLGLQRVARDVTTLEAYAAKKGAA
jgi:hypothetical protein